MKRSIRCGVGVVSSAQQLSFWWSFLLVGNHVPNNCSAFCQKVDSVATPTRAIRPANGAIVDLG
jgi:hypothetical protein